MTVVAVASTAGDREPICGGRDDREPFPKQLDECFFASRVTTATCNEQHITTNPYGCCLDPNGVPCFCQTSFTWEIGLALYAVDIKAGSYANIHPPQGAPGKAGGRLILRESADGKYVSLEGIV